MSKQALDQGAELPPKHNLPPSKSSSSNHGKSAGKKIQFRYKDQSVYEAPRPVLSYNELIIEAIKTADNGMLSLQDIYDYIQDSYDYFKTTTVAWQNSIRHNLSVQKIFERVPRPVSMPGKGGLWRLAPVYEIETRSPEQIQADIINRGVSEKKKPASQARRTRNKRKRYESEESEEEQDYQDEEDGADFGRFSMSNTPRKRHSPVKQPQSAPPTASSFRHAHSSPGQVTGNHHQHNNNSNIVESTGGTLVNSPFVTTTKLNPHEYQGTHLMDTLANIALSAEAHTFDWSLNSSADTAPSAPSLLTFSGISGAAKQWPNSATSINNTTTTTTKSIPIQLPPKKYHTQFRNHHHQLPPPPTAAAAGMMLMNPLVAEQTLFQATGGRDLGGNPDSDLI